MITPNFHYQTVWPLFRLVHTKYKRLDSNCMQNNPEHCILRGTRQTVLNSGGDGAQTPFFSPPTRGIYSALVLSVEFTNGMIRDSPFKETRPEGEPYTESLNI